MKAHWMTLDGKLRERLCRSFWIAVLTLGWYLLMLTMPIPREILMGSSNELPGNGTAISLFFCVLTGTAIAGYFYQSPGIGRRWLRILFSLPFPLFTAAVFVLSVSLVNRGARSGGPTEMEFWTAHFVAVPIVLIFIAWLPLLVMHPITVAVSERLIDRRKSRLGKTADRLPTASFPALGGASR